jgi:hypothetical protein
MKDLKQFIKTTIREFLNEEQHNNGSIESIIEKYKKDTEYDIKNSLGNCSFFTRDVINWANKNGIKADYIYMPMSKEYRRKNKIGNDFGGNDDDWEDHIVPMINGKIIDFTYTNKGVSHKVRNKNTIPPITSEYSKSLFEPNGMYGRFGYTNPEINTEYGNPKNINQFQVRQPKLKNLQESIDKTAGVWVTDEKFEDGTDFKIKFKVSDIIKLAKNKPVKEVNPKSINYDFSGRKEDERETNKRVMDANLSYPILVVQNDKGEIFGMLDGTHRLQKALKMGLDKIKIKIFNKEELLRFKVEEFKY